MNHEDPMDVAINAMSVHSLTTLEYQEVEREDPKSGYWMHLNAAADIAVKILPYFRVKAEGAQVKDPTAELEELKRLFHALDDIAQKRLLTTLRSITNDNEENPRC